MLRKQQAVGVITAKKSALSKQHLENANLISIILNNLKKDEPHEIRKSAPFSSG
jgi:hypothetical protein